MSKEVKISTFTGALTRLGTPTLVVDTLKKAGFDYYDFTMMCPILGFELFYDSDDYLEKAKEFRRYCDSIGIYCNQTHGSVPLLAKGIDEKTQQELIDRAKRTIEVSHILGANRCVLHPSDHHTIEENVKIFKLLADAVKENDMIIAVENLPGHGLFSKPQDFKKFLKKMNDSHFKVCLDIGHAEIEQTGSSAVSFIKTLKDDIVCLHIHDNEKVNDIHQLPFTYSISFNEIFEALKKNKYQGDITFETGTYFNNIPNSLFLDALKLLHDLGEYIANKVFE